MAVYGETAGMPGCCGVRIMHNLTTTKPRTGYYCRAEDICNDERVNTLLATTNQRMVEVNAALKEEGWLEQKLPDSPKTGNELILWIYEKKELLDYYDDDEDDY